MNREAVAPAAAIEAAFTGRRLNRIGVAVSGGSDSLALLHLLHDWGGAELSVVTVDHALRPGSAGEALHVARICEGLGLSHDVLTWDGWDGRGNLQDQARRTRYSLLADWGRRTGVGLIALGHTMDDQAETFLMRLARGGGVDGLSAMAGQFTRHDMAFERPLLACRRADLRADLVARGVRWVEDPSNEDERFDRIRVRKAMESFASIGLTAETLARTAGHLGEAREALNTVAAKFAEAHGRVEAGDVILDRAALGREPRELRRRLVSAALRWVAGEHYPPRHDAMDALLLAVQDRRNMTLHGCLVMVSDMTVRLTREASAVGRVASTSDALWDGRWRLEGPHAADLEVRVLGDALRDCPDWRATGLPRQTLAASPSIWRENRLISAPLAGFSNGWSATAPGMEAFVAQLFAH